MRVGVFDHPRGRLRAEYRLAIAEGRWVLLRLALLAPILLFLMAVWPAPKQQIASRNFLEGLWPEAQAMGVSRATFDQALRGVEPDLALPDLVLPGKSDVKGQAEFTKTPAQYVSAPYLAKLSEQGKSLQTQHAIWLAKIERELGVQRQFVLAIWGRETAFGAHRSTHYAVKALATQAYLGRRKDMFRTELLLCAEDAAGRRAHARDHDRVLGRRHGPHPVHALGILHHGLRPRRRRPQGHLGLGGGRPGIGGQPAARQGLGAKPELGLRGAPAQGRLLPAGGTGQRQAAAASG